MSGSGSRPYREDEVFPSSGDIKDGRPLESCREFSGGRLEEIRSEYLDTREPSADDGTAQPRCDRLSFR